MNVGRVTTLIFLLVMTTGHAFARDGDQHSSFKDLSARCAPNIHIRTIASLVRLESALNPLAINVNSGSRLDRQPRTNQEAVTAAEGLIKQGANFDAGLAQINSANLNWLGLSVADLFDPCKNLKAAASVLSDCYQRGVGDSGEGQQALREALSCYNTGTLGRGFRNGYVRNVVAETSFPVPELLPWNAPEPQATRNDSVEDRTDPKPIRVRLVSAHPNDTAREEVGDIFQNAYDHDAFLEKNP